MIQINLVPDVKLELIRAQRHRNLIVSGAIIITIAAATIVGLLAAYVYGYQLFMSQDLDNKITKRDAEFRGKKDIVNTVTIQNQLKSLETKHENKAMTSRIFGLLSVASAKDTDNSVSVSAFSVDTTAKTISITGQTDKKGFEAAEVFRKNVEGLKMYYIPYVDSLSDDSNKSADTSKCDPNSCKTIASDVQLSDVSYGQSQGSGPKTVTFKLSFTYADEFMSAKYAVLDVKGLEKGNVTDSFVRIPNSLFTNTKPGEGK